MWIRQIYPFPAPREALSSMQSDESHGVNKTIIGVPMVNICLFGSMTAPTFALFKLGMFTSFSKDEIGVYD